MFCSQTVYVDLCLISMTAPARMRSNLDYVQVETLITDVTCYPRDNTQQIFQIDLTILTHIGTTKTHCLILIDIFLSNNYDT